MPKNQLDKLLGELDSSPFDHELWDKLFVLQRSRGGGGSQEVGKYRLYRYTYAEKYQTLPSFWLEWLGHEIEYASGQTTADNDEKMQAPVRKLFTDALKQCPHCDIASSYVDYVKDRHASELATAKDMRKVFNEVLGVCGLDVVRGAKLWSSYLTFEVEDFEDKVELHKNNEAFGTDAETIKEAKMRLAKLFQRQLSLPLMNTEETLSRLEAVTEEYFSEEDMSFLQPNLLSEEVERSVLERSSLVPHETQVSVFEDQAGGGEEEDPEKKNTAPTVAMMVDKWCEYAHFELERGSYHRACRVFERAVLSIHSQVGTVLTTGDVGTTAAVHRLWKSFVETIIFQKKRENMQNASGKESAQGYGHGGKGSDSAATLLHTEVTTRALKTCFAHLNVWKYHWLALELAGTDTKSLQMSHYSALQAGFSSGEDYMGVLVSWCEHLCRRVEAANLYFNASDDSDGAPPTKRKRGEKSQTTTTSGSASPTDTVESLLATYTESVEYSEQWLEQYYPTWEKGWVRWAQCVAETEHHFSIAGLWQAGSGSGSGSSSSSDVWDRVMARFPLLSPEGVSQALKWRALRRWARPEDRLQALQKCRDLHIQNLRESERLLASASASPEHAQALKASCTDWEAFERLHGDCQSLIDCLETTSTVLTRRKEGMGALTSTPAQQKNETSADIDTGTSKTSEAKRKAAAAAGGASSAGEKELQGDDPVPTSTIHVKSIHFDATEQDLLEIFRPLAARCRGDMEEDEESAPRSVAIPEVFLPRAHSGRSKGEAFVTFDSVGTAQLVVAAASADTGPGVRVLDRPVLVTMLSEKEHCKMQKLREAPETTTVFVSGFPKEWQAEHLQTLFAHCGAIIAGKVLKRRGPSDESPGQGMVQFKVVQGRQNAFQLNKHQLDQAGHRSVIQVALSKFPIISSSEASSAPVVMAEADKMTVPYLPPPVTELGKGKPKRAALSFKPSALL